MAKKNRKIEAVNPMNYRPGTVTHLNLSLYEDALGNELCVPFIVVRGTKPGPTVGITAAVHGNELNGISIIHRLLEGIDAKSMSGALLCVPVVNGPGFNGGQRRFPEDNVDLNHVFPGKRGGTPSQQYAKNFMTAFIPHCEYLIDIHTASEGRINTLYVRADLHSKPARELAELIKPTIILHGRSGDGTLRSAARRQGIPSITLEAGNPSVFQGKMILEGESGIQNILSHLNVMPGERVADGVDSCAPAIICKDSKWLRTDAGGLMHYHFQLAEQVKKGQLLVELVNVFGEPIKNYKAPNDGVVIGMAQSPISFPGTRFCHLGSIGEPKKGSPAP